MSEDVGSQLAGIFKLYSKEVTDEIKAAAIKISSEAVKKLKAASPKRTGTYKKGWTMKTTKNTPNEIEITIYNRKPRAGHLLEHGTGHRSTRKGYNRGSMPKKEHIKPVEEWANKELEEAVEKAVKK